MAILVAARCSAFPSRVVIPIDASRSNTSTTPRTYDVDRLRHFEQNGCE